VQYDLARFTEHLGPTPSVGLLAELADKVGQFTVHIGGTASGSVLSISILDLVEAFDRPDSVSLLDILKTARVILESRLASAEELGLNDQKREDLQRAINSYEDGTLPLVLLSPVLFDNRHWQYLVNDFFHQHLVADLQVTKVLVVEHVDAGTTSRNIDWQLGYLNRHADIWRTGQYLQTVEVTRLKTPFDNLVQDEPGYCTWAHRHEYEETARWVPIPDYVGLQVMFSSYGPFSLPLERVEKITTPALGELGQLPNFPSLFVTFWRKRGKKAMQVLDRILNAENSTHDELPHPDARLRLLRYFPDVASPQSIHDLVGKLNSSDTDGLLHAGVWAFLFQDQDDEKVRTIICKSGLLPELRQLQEVDPSVTVVSRVHGCARIRSDLPTSEWRTRLRAFNTSTRATARGVFRDSLYPFQAIRDGTGLHWICPQASSPSARLKGWSRSEDSGYVDARPNIRYSVIHGPALNWPPDTIMEALTELKLDEFTGGMQWVHIEGEKSKKLVFPSQLSSTNEPTTILFKSFISVTVEPLDPNKRFSVIRQVFGRKGTVDLDLVDTVLAKAAKSSDLGSREEDHTRRKFSNTIGPPSQSPDLDHS